MRIVVYLPLPAIEFCGALLGKLLYIALPGRRQVADINLRIAFPDASDNEIIRLRKLCFKNMGIAGFELALSWWQDKRILDLCEVEGLQHITQLQAEGKGVIILTAHFTCLEIGGPVLNHYVPFQVMYKPAHNKLFDAFMRHHRSRLYKAIVDYHKPMAMIKGLKKGHAAWYAPDQDYGREQSVFVPFFGIPAASITATSRLARISGAAVVPFFQNRLPDARGYQLTLYPALESFPGESVETDTRRINKIIEARIREQPGQYLWVHRRFKTRPEGEPDVYK